MLTVVDEHVPGPNPLVDECGSGLPSPAMNLGEQFRLVKLLSSRFGQLAGIEDDHRAREVVSAVNEWLDQLPKELRLDSHTQNQEESCHWLLCQRLSLHCFAFMARLTPLKRVLTASSNATTHQQSRSMDLKRLSVRLCIECMDMGLALHRAVHPLRGNFHFVIFVLFDTATVMCSAILHDSGNDLPERPALLKKAHEALHALDLLTQHARSARRGAEVLRWLMDRLGQRHYDRESTHDALDSLTQQPFHVPTQATGSTTARSMGAAPSTIEPFPDLGSPFQAATTEPIWKANTSLNSERPPQLPLFDRLNFEDLLDSDMGGLESIWDWEGLGFSHTL